MTAFFRLASKEKPITNRITPCGKQAKGVAADRSTSTTLQLAVQTFETSCSWKAMPCEKVEKWDVNRTSHR